MELKPGYKQTEVGVIPQDWNVSHLGALAETSSGTTPPRAMQDRYFRSGSIAWVKTMDLTNSELVTTSEYVTELALKETCLKVYPIGTVLVAMYGGFQQIGRTSLLRKPAAVNQAITAIQPKADRLVSEYLLGTLNYRVDYWKNVASSSRKDPNITSQDIRNFPIAYASPLEQQAIAAALSDVDALIGALNKLIAKKRDIKQAAMQQLLTGKQRLPGFNRKLGYRQTEVGVIPVDWNAGCLGEKTSKVGSGITPTGGERVYKKEGRPFIRSQNVGWGTLLMEEIAFIDDETHRTFQATEIEADDVFLNITGASIGRSAVADARVTKGNVNQHVCIIRSNQKELHPRFLNYFLLSSAGQRQIDSFQAGGNRQGLNFAQIRSIQLPIPPLLEQCAIAAALSDIDAELSALGKNRDKIRAIKQGMMQELLTGKTRLI